MKENRNIIYLNSVLGMYMCVCVCVCVCIYIHIYTYIYRLWDWSSPWQTPSFIPKSEQKCLILGNVFVNLLDLKGPMQSKCPSI